MSSCRHQTSFDTCPKVVISYTKLHVCTPGGFEEVKVHKCTHVGANQKFAV